MLDFFSDEGGLSFALFSKQHIAISIITIIAILLIYINRDKLKGNRNTKAIRYSIATILFVNMLVFYLLFVIKGQYTWREHLPLHLCFITGYMFMLALITNNKKLFKYVYLFTIIGPVPAMIWPEIAQGCNRFIFWQFFISHHFVVIASMYCLFVLNYNVSKKNIFSSFLIANVYFFTMYIFNLCFGTNYVMSTQLPKHVIGTYPFLTNFNFPIFWLELTGIVAMLMSYIPVKIINDNNLKNGNLINITEDKMHQKVSLDEELQGEML